MTGYIYDGDGERVAKGTIAAWSCDPSTNGFQLTQSYVRSAGGESLTVMGPNGTPLYQNVSGAGRLLVAYDSQGTHYQVTDPLGTRRMQTDAQGVPEMDFEELPYGDGLTAIPDPNDMDEADDATPFHFTGKERDAESGNDYFEARYYSSAMGRFMSPDWSAKEDPVPYAQLDDPQSLNLYSYVRNNPLSKADPDGHCGLPVCPGQMALFPDPRPFQMAGKNPYVRGGLEIMAAALAGPEASVAIEEATTVTQGLGAGVTVLGVTGTAVNGVTDIAGAATHTEVNESTDAVTSVTNPVAAGTAIVSGSMEKGSQASDLKTVVTAGADLAKGKGIKNPAEVATSLKGAKEAVSGAIEKAKSAVSGAFTSAPAPPPTPKAPSRPPCTVAGAC